MVFLIGQKSHNNAIHYFHTNWGISSIGRVRRSQRRGTGIETRILQSFSTIFKQIGIFILTTADISQLGERQTEDLKVPGSIPGGGTVFLLSFHIAL